MRTVQGTDPVCLRDKNDGLKWSVELTQRLPDFHNSFVLVHTQLLGHTINVD
jgi:hypothetical protein